MNDKEYEGSPEAVVGEMWGECFHRDTLVHVEAYITYVAANVFRFTGIGIDVGKRTVEEKSRQLLDGLIAAGFASKLEN
jgi:hypothetical protein